MQYERRVSLLESSSAALNEILDDLLDHAKLAAGRFNLVPQPGDLHELLHHVVETFRVAASSKGLALVLEEGEGLPQFAVFDAQRMRQVVSNLVSNAVKYTDAGCVRVSADATAEEGHWRLTVTVADTGRGISDAQIGGLFRDYARIDATEQAGIPGTGLGLVISRGLAKLMGGDITVKSVVGRGSEFTFTARLGIAARPALISTSPDEHRVAKPPFANIRRVLVADDSRANRFVLRSFLKGPDLEVVEAEDGTQALAALRASPFDLAILDIQMPGMSGIEVFAAVRRAGSMNRTTPVICVTGHLDAGEAERCLAMGMIGYLTKPVKKDALWDAMGSAAHTRAA